MIVKIHQDLITEPPEYGHPSVFFEGDHNTTKFGAIVSSRCSQSSWIHVDGNCSVPGAFCREYPPIKGGGNPLNVVKTHQIQRQSCTSLYELQRFAPPASPFPAGEAYGGENLCSLKSQCHGHSQDAITRRHWYKLQRKDSGTVEC